MVITATTLEELAGQLVRLVVTTWARAVNNRPRTDRAGRSRVQLYEDAAPTEQQIAAARAALRDRQRKQERARETKCRRQDPLARAALDDAFERLGLDDPERVLRVAIASWPLDAILAGIAVFEGKKRRGTLPNAVDARYLRGIVKNLAEEAESWAIADALLSERLRARDRALHALCADRAGIQATLAHHDAPELLRCYVDRATVTPRNIDRLFWLRAAADIVLDLPEPERRPLLRIAARRIAAAYSLAKRDRDAAIRFLFAKAVPVS